MWKLEARTEAFMPIMTSLKALKPIDGDHIDGDHDVTRVIQAQSRKIVAVLNRSMIAVSEQRVAYEAVIGKLADHHDVDALRGFLENAETMFKEIGDSASIFDHCLDFRDFGLPNVNPRTLTAERALDIVNGLAAPLSLDVPDMDDRTTKLAG